jgi:hypothetical protein
MDDLGHGTVAANDDEEGAAVVDVLLGEFDGVAMVLSFSACPLAWIRRVQERFKLHG